MDVANIDTQSAEGCTPYFFVAHNALTALKPEPILKHQEREEHDLLENLDRELFRAKKIMS